MSEKKISTQQLILSGRRTIGMSPADLDKILSSPQFYPVKPKIVQKATTVVSLPKETKPTQADQVIALANVGKDVAGKIADVIRDRAKDLTMIVDPIKKESLYQACVAVFGPRFDGKITWEMYENLLAHNRTMLTKLRK